MEMANPLLLAWFALTFVGTAWVAYDLYTRTPAMSVMKPGWVLVCLYLGPIGVVLYVVTCRPPGRGLEAHDAYIKPTWRQAAGSAVHCVAGDATGVIVAATVAASIGLTPVADIVLEYTLGFLFGLFIFQAVFMQSMLGGYWLAVKKTVYAEWVSMNFVMAGMIPVMMIGRHAMTGAESPLSWNYWFVMQASAVVGYALAYPINYYLVGKGVKHGMMTQRPKQAKPADSKTHDTPHGEHAGHEMKHDMPGMSHGEHTGHDMSSMAGGHDHEHMAMGAPPSTGTLVFAAAVSVVVLAVGVTIGLALV